MAKIKVKAESQLVGDPAIPIFKIVIVDEEKNGIWEETYGSFELAEAFLKGVRAAFSFTDVGLANIPPIPRPIM